MPSETNVLVESESLPSIIDITSLPEAASANAVPLPERIVDIATKKMADHLVHAAKYHLKALQSQKKDIEDSTSNLALLMQRVNLQKSLITRACEWYGQKTAFEKAFIGLMFVATAALVGAIMNLTVVFGVLAAGVYLAIGSILQEHYEANLERDKQFCSDIYTMEQTLAESIEHLKEMEVELQPILIALAEKNVQSAKQVLTFEKGIVTLNEKIADAEQTVIELERVKHHLTDENAQITAKLNVRYVHLEEANHSIIQRSSELRGVQHQMSETNERIAAKTCQLDTLSEKLQADSIALSTLIEGYEAQLKLLRTRVSTPVPEESRAASLNDISEAELRRRTDESIAKDKALIARIRLRRQSRDDVPLESTLSNMSMSQ